MNQRARRKSARLNELGLMASTILQPTVRARRRKTIGTEIQCNSHRFRGRVFRFSRKSARVAREEASYHDSLVLPVHKQ